MIVRLDRAKVGHYRAPNSKAEIYHYLGFFIKENHMISNSPTIDDTKLLELMLSLDNPLRLNHLKYNIYSPEVQTSVKEKIERGHYLDVMQLIWSTHVSHHQFEGSISLLSKQLHVATLTAHWLQENAYPHPPLMFELGIAKAKKLILEHSVYQTDKATRDIENKTLFKLVCQIFMDADFLTRLACENTNAESLRSYNGICRKKYSEIFDTLIKLSQALESKDTIGLENQIMSSKKRILVDIQEGIIPFPVSTWVLSYGRAVDSSEYGRVVEDENELLIIEKYIHKMRHVKTISDQSFYWRSNKDSSHLALTLG